MKTVFLTGTLKSSYLLQFIENVLEPLNFSIYMQLPVEEYENAKEFLKIHKINFIKYYEKKDCLLFKIRFFGGGLRAALNFFEIIKHKKFDYVHVQSVWKFVLLQAKFAAGKNTKCYASFWGSDLLRQTEKYLKSEEMYLRNYELISADGYTLKNAYERIYHKLNVKFEMIPYGVSLISYIDKYSSDVNACKKKFDFPLNKKIVAIGYNAIKQQQHDKVMDALKNIADKDYVPNLIKKIENSGFEYKIIKDYLSMDDLAKLRIATDIFINAQTTDAFANSFIENVYTKSIIINAKWLHYPELDMFPLYVNEFSDFNEIPSLLEKRIDDEKLEWNKKCIENRTWENCRKQWAKAYGVEYKE